MCVNEYVCECVHLSDCVRMCVNECVCICLVMADRKADSDEHGEDSASTDKR